MRKITWAWEALDEHTYRVKVFKGWMVVSETLSNKGNIDVTSIFVPDTDHEWMPVKPSAPTPIGKETIPDALKVAGK